MLEKIKLFAADNGKLTETLGGVSDQVKTVLWGLSSAFSGICLVVIIGAFIFRCIKVSLSGNEPAERGNHIKHLIWISIMFVIVLIAFAVFLDFALKAGAAATSGIGTQ